MKSDLYKVPPPKIRNIPIYELEREKTKQMNTKRKPQTHKQRERRERILFARVRAHARGSVRDIVSEPAKRERVNARARERKIRQTQQKSCNTNL